MKEGFILRCALLYLFIGISAFSNNKINHTPNDLRLIRMEIISGSSSSTVFLRYDQSGRITNVSASLNSAPAQTVFNVSYQDDRIIMTEPAKQSTYADAPDAIILFLDANSRVVKKIAHHVHDIKSIPTPDQHQVSYLYDSTIYQYDVNGKLIMEIITSQDSIVGDKGTSTINKTMHLMNYNPVETRIGLLNHSAIKSTTTRNGAKVTTSENYISSTLTFEYLNDYPFQTDFSNAAVLNELHPFTDLTVIGGYAFLPSSIGFVSTQVHNAGNVTRDTGSVSFQFSYDNIRMVSSMKSSAIRNWETRYVYGPPSR